MNLDFGSVCSGIEAASVAWAPLDWKADWLAEVDVAASQVLAHRLGATAPLHPLPGTEKQIAKLRWREEITNYGDMTVLPQLVRDGIASAPSLLCGGTPCQAFSVAGRREGMSDPRGGLTLAFVDLADAIDEVRIARGDEPRIVYWENVPGVLTDAGNAFGCFLAALVGDDEPVEPGPRPEPGRPSAHWTWDKKTSLHRPKWTDAGLVVGPQRTVGWRIGDAQYFELAQRRRRVVLVGSAREGFDPAAILLEFDRVRRDFAPSRETGEAVAGTLDARIDGGGFPGSDGAAQYHVVPHGLGSERPSGPVGIGPDGTQPLYYQHDWAHGRVYGVDGVAPALTCGHEAGGKNILAPTWWDGSPISQTLDAVLHKGQTMPEKNRFPAVLQPIPILEAGARTGVSTTDIRAGIGIGEAGDPMFTLQSSKQHAVCVTGSVTHTLRAEGFDASEDGTGRGHPIVASGSHHMAVRRLMPIECHRLQGFPDDWCAVPIGNKIAADGPQYKQLGNSWAVNHARWVGQRIQAWLEREAARKNDDMADLLS